MMMVDVWNLRPTAARFTEDRRHANDRTWRAELLAKLPVVVF